MHWNNSKKLLIFRPYLCLAQCEKTWVLRVIVPIMHHRFCGNNNHHTNNVIFSIFLKKRSDLRIIEKRKREVVVTYRLRKQYKPRDDLFLHQTAYLYSKIWNTRNIFLYQPHVKKMDNASPANFINKPLLQGCRPSEWWVLLLDLWWCAS